MDEARTGGRAKAITVDRTLMAAILVLQVVVLLDLRSRGDARSASQGALLNEKPAARNGSSRPRDTSGQGFALTQSSSPGGSSAPAGSVALPTQAPTVTAGARLAGLLLPARGWPAGHGLTLREADRLHRQMNDVLAHAMSDFEQMDSFVNWDEGWGSLVSSPTMDMRDENDRYVVLFSLPGLVASDVKVTMEGRLLTVTSESKSQARQVQQTHAFERKVWLPGPVKDEQMAEAVLTNGVLKITVPKAQDTHPADANMRLM